MSRNKTDVLVVGAGPAGLAAALELKRIGVKRVTVVEREKEAGGIPRLCHHTGFGMRDWHRIYSGPKYAQRYVQRALANGVDIRTLTTITGWSDRRSLTYVSPQGLGTIDARTILLATGCRERPRAARLIPGSRPQGIFTTGSLQRFVDEYQLPVGKRAVIVGAELVSLSAYMTLKRAGLETVAITTRLPEHQIYFPYRPIKWLLVDLVGHASVRTSSRIGRILGRKRVEGVEIVDEDTGQVEIVKCDTIIFTGDWIPENSIAREGGLAIDTGTNGPQVDGQFRTTNAGVFAVGNLLRGVETADMAALEGRRAAQHIYRFLRDDIWPSRALPIEIESPVQWVCPNSVAVMKEMTLPKQLSFIVSETLQDALIQICQGSNVLSKQKIGHIAANKIVRITNNAPKTPDPNGGSLSIKLVV